MLDKQYDPKHVEPKWYAFWEQNGFFEPSKEDRAYCIMLPPPNVTGSLHMGHAFQHTLIDILIRYHRMRGFSTLWQCGTDHAGIATQMVVERQLALQNIDRKDIGREAFMNKVWDWKQTSGRNISRQLRQIGASMDWSRECFTMDPDLSQAVEHAFITLYDQGLIYRGKRLVNWDPVLKTAISDLEVVSKEESGHLWTIQYPTEDEKDAVKVATTRPETLFGDVAVAVHPDDDRYQHLVGTLLRLPLTDRLIPVIADTFVDPEFGTGCVKVTPAHDFNDHKIGKRHDLPLLNIFDEDIRLNAQVPKIYQGLDRDQARKTTLQDLQKEGYLISSQKHTLHVPRGDRSGAVIEPYLTDQWFLNVTSLAQSAMNAVRSGKIQFVPENWSKTFFEWMEHIEDWCISRQLWWGHRIPAWFDDKGAVYVGASLEEVKAKYNLNDTVILRQENDVLDTWFSSALWPFSTLGWPNQTNELNRFYPTDVLVTGFDIIFFWVARMIMFGLHFTKQIPFHQVYIHGLVRDAEGQKMSKSRGNIIDPIDLIHGIDLETLVEKRTQGLMNPAVAPSIAKATRKHFPQGLEAYGADALRFNFAALATYGGRDIRFDTGRLGGSRAFCNKLWNAARFVFMTCEACCVDKVDLIEQQTSLNWADRWILGAFTRLEAEVTLYIEKYRFDLASKQVYHFTWNLYCDWYLEISKINLQDDHLAVRTKQLNQACLVRVLEGVLRLLHPFIPFITEEIWHSVAKILKLPGRVIAERGWPNPQEEFPIDTTEDDHFSWFSAIAQEIRSIRTEHEIPLATRLQVFLRTGIKREHDWLALSKRQLLGITRVASIEFTNREVAQFSAVRMAGTTEIVVPLEGMIDQEVERKRLTKKIGKYQKEYDSLEQRLQNNDFIERAPKALVAKERVRLEELEQKIDRINQFLLKMKHMENK